MKRISAVTFLVAMILAFLLPVAILLIAAIARIFGDGGPGIRAVAGGFDLVFSPLRIALLLLLILALATLGHWLGQKIFGRRN
jgi:hypothetical protein